MKIEKFEDMKSWQKARELTTLVYEFSKEGAFSRDFALRDQMRRASISVMSNIAEGFARGGDGEFYQFLSIAKASCSEVQSQLYIALDQQYIVSERFQVAYKLAEEINKMIHSFMDYLHNSQ